LVIEGVREAEPGAAGRGRDPVSIYEDLTASGVDRREALRRIARELGLPRREVYRALLEADEEREE
jgi:hypothetical protein